MTLEVNKLVTRFCFDSTVDAVEYTARATAKLGERLNAMQKSTEKCPDCNGRGEHVLLVSRQTCETCGGSGTAPVHEPPPVIKIYNQRLVADSSAAPLDPALKQALSDAIRRALLKAT